MTLFEMRDAVVVGSACLSLVVLGASIAIFLNDVTGRSRK